jgi:hypothetical protein
MRWPVAVVVGAALLIVASVTQAHHRVFTYRLDAVAIDGNSLGPADGVPDLVDDHDNGVHGPTWQPGGGTSFETGGFLVLTNPGFHYYVAGVYYDITNVASTVSFADGLGNFTATGTWAAELPAMGDGIDFALFNGGTLESAGVGIVNYWGPAFRLRHLVSGTTALRTDLLPIDPGSLSGPIVLRLAFDDAANTVAGSFSLDGAATFETPFAPMALTTGLGGGNLLVGAVNLVDIGPTTTSTSTSSTTSTSLLPPGGCPGAAALGDVTLVLYRRSVVDGDESLALRATIPIDFASYDPSLDGARVIVHPEPLVAPSAIVFDVTVPPGGVGTGCGPRDGWRTAARSYRYVNTTDALPPTCLPGSARRLKKLKVSRTLDGTIAVRLGTRLGTYELPRSPSFSLLPERETIALGQGPVGPGRCATVVSSCIRPEGPVGRCTGP